MIISHQAPAALLRAEKNIIKLGSNVCVCVCVYIQGSRLRPFFESASKNLTWSHLCECMLCSAPKRALPAQEKDFTDHVKRGASARALQ